MNVMCHVAVPISELAEEYEEEAEEEDEKEAESKKPAVV